MKSQIQSVEVSYFVHATEDQGKIATAVVRMLGVKGPARSEELTGHHGNRILSVSYHVTGDDATAAFDGLIGRLSGAAKKVLPNDINKMIDEHSTLYLRLDKQSLVSGKLELGGDETVRVRVKPRLFMHKGGAQEFYRRTLEGVR